MQIPFAKLHGLGNDFIVTSIRAWGAAERIRTRGRDKKSRWPPGSAFLRRLAEAICDRHAGIGADGFLVIDAAAGRMNSACVRFFNADGSEAEMSGNGIRCAAAYMMEAEDAKSPLRIETLAGVRTIEVASAKKGGWVFRVAMGRPVLDPRKIPFTARNATPPVVGYPLPLETCKQPVTVTSMGNPHCSVFVKRFENVDWPVLGREIENHPLFPNRTNVEFVKIISRREIEVRYWERGVGITASSGTGSCGAAVAAILNGLAHRRLRVRTIAGVLEVDWPEGGEVALTGPAEWIASGTYRYS